MCEPERQDYHGVDRFDDLAIGNDDKLLRHLRIPVQVVPAHNGYRLSDRAFVSRKSETGTSVDLECLLLIDGLSSSDRRGAMPGSKALASVTVEHARTFSAGVAWTPKPEEPELEHEFARAANPYHGEIINPMSGKQARDLAAKATILWTAAGVLLGPFEGQSPIVDDTPIASNDG